MIHADRDGSERELAAYLAADKADYERTWKGDGYARAEAAEAKVAELEGHNRAGRENLEHYRQQIDALAGALADERAKVARVEALAGRWEEATVWPDKPDRWLRGAAARLRIALDGDA